MADPISIAEKIIAVALYIHETVDEIKKFKDAAKELNYKIQLLEPSLQVLMKMKNERERILAAQEKAEMHLFTRALTELAMCVEEIKRFIDKHKDVGFFDKLMNKRTIKETYEDFAKQLDTLTGSIQFAVLVEMANEKKKPTLQTLVDCLVTSMKKSKSSTSAEKEGKTYLVHDMSDIDNANNEKYLERAKEAAKVQKKMVDLLSPKDPDTLSDTDINVLEALGKGEYGIGAVHRVTFKKRYMGQTEAAAKMVTPFKQEDIGMLKKLSHPNIATVYGVIEGMMKAKFILREYALETLQAYLLKTSEAISPQLLGKWTRQSAKAIEYLHKNQVIIGSIKSSNCLLFQDHEGKMLKLCDFGLSKKIVRASAGNVIAGYMAPEINKEDDFSFASDMFDYGMLLLEMVRGRAELRKIKSLESQEMDFQESKDDDFYAVNDYMNLKLSDIGNVSKNVMHLLCRCLRSCPRSRPTPSQALDMIAGGEQPTVVAAASHAKVNHIKSDREHAFDITLHLKDMFGTIVKNQGKVEAEVTVYTPRDKDHEHTEQVQFLRKEGAYVSERQCSPLFDGKYRIVLKVNGDTIGNRPLDCCHFRQVKHAFVAHKKATPSGLKKPHDIKEFNDTYIIADAFNNRVIITNRSFAVIKELPKPLNGQFKPYGIAINGEDIFVTDNAAPGRVVVYEDGGNGKPWEFGQQDLKRPTGIVALMNKIYVIDHFLGCIKVFTLNMWEKRVVSIDTISQRGSGPHDLNCPWLATFNSKNELLVVDCCNKRIQIFEPERSDRAIREIPVIVNGTPMKPRGIAVDADDKIFVTAMSHTNIRAIPGIPLVSGLQCVVVFSQDGQYLGTFGSADKLWWPRGLAIIHYGKESKKALITNDHCITEYDLY